MENDNKRSRPTAAFIAKAAAAAITGVAALMLLRRLHREELVASIRREVRESLLPLLPVPPSILVLGFRSQGRSSFLNTVCRVLAAESGPLLVRAETAPAGPGGAASPAPRSVRAEVADAGVGPGGAGSTEWEEPAVELVDAPPLIDPAVVTRDDVESALAGARPAAECVALVLRCGGSARDKHLSIKKLPEISAAVRERGLHMVVVLTQRKALKSKKQAEELRREVAFKARTDCVYFIENYTAAAGAGFDLRRRFLFAGAANDFETQLTVLAIVRQCVEFVGLHRAWKAAEAAAAAQRTTKNDHTKHGGSQKAAPPATSP